MKYPYALIADIHLHHWSAFVTDLPTGVNSRLQGLLDEIHRAATQLKLCGGDTLIVAGDLFHVRGMLATPVLNVALDTFRMIASWGVKVHILPGNHDLTGKESSRLGSAVEALGTIEGITTYVEPVHLADSAGLGDVILVPWVDKVDDLRTQLADMGGCSGVDLIIHAPVDGVIKGLPEHGLKPQELADLGFRRVFAGHYHNHVSFCDGKVWSIGALAHHSWSDVGSVAGFCMVYPDRVEHFPSQLPKFVDVMPEQSAGEVSKAVEGNFARVRVTTSKLADIEKMRKWLMEQGAVGTVVMPVKAPVEARDGAIAASVHAGASIQQSVCDFVKSLKHGYEKEVELEALRVLAEAEVE